MSGKFGYIYVRAKILIFPFKHRSGEFYKNANKHSLIFFSKEDKTATLHLGISDKEKLPKSLFAYISGLSDGLICQIKGFCYRDVKFLGSNGHHLDQPGDHIDPFADRIDPFADRVDQSAGHIDQVADRIDQVANRFDQVADRMDQTSDRMAQVADRIDQVDDHIDKVADHIDPSGSRSTHKNRHFKPAVSLLHLRTLWFISIFIFSKLSNQPKNSFFRPIIQSKKYIIKSAKNFRNFAIYWNFTVGRPKRVGYILTPKNQGIKFWFEKLIIMGIEFIVFFDLAKNS